MDCEGGSNELFEYDASASNDKRVTFSPLILVLNKDQPEATPEETESSLAESPDCSDTLSSSSSNSSLDDFIPINPELLLKSKGENRTPHPNGGTKSSCVEEKCNVKSEGFYRLEESTYECSASQLSEATHEPVTEHVLPTLSPSIQVMECPQVFNYNRICASHSRMPSKLKEDNAASDDSLFIKPDEEAKSDISKVVGEDVKPGEKGIVDEPINDISKAPLNNQVDKNRGDSMNSSTAKFQSDKSSTDNVPIVSPIKKKSSYPFFHCPECCPTFHCCNCPIRCCNCPIHCFKWPSCSFKWLTRPSCFRNCFSWLGCCFKCPTHCSKWPGCSFNWLIQPCCSFNWLIQPCCSGNCLSWLGCCCKLPSCHHCKCPIWSSCCVKRKS